MQCGRRAHPAAVQDKREKETEMQAQTPGLSVQQVHWVSLPDPRGKSLHSELLPGSLFLGETPELSRVATGAPWEARSHLSPAPEEFTWEVASAFHLHGHLWAGT